MITRPRFPALITTSAVMTFTMLPIGRSVSSPSLHKICPVAALASAPALIRIPVGPGLAVVPPATAAAFGAMVLAETGMAAAPPIARAARTTRNARTASGSAISLRNFDSSIFNAWFIAFTLNSPQKEAIAVHRFRPQFLVAFNAWMATDPLHNPHAPPGPTYMPQYKQPEQAQANTLDNESAAKFQTGNQAALISDNYVRITVFLAAVLFLVGIGSSFKLPGVRYALVGFGSVLLILSVVLILQQPALPS